MRREPRRKRRRARKAADRENGGDRRSLDEQNMSILKEHMAHEVRKADDFRARQKEHDRTKIAALPTIHRFDPWRTNTCNAFAIASGRPHEGLAYIVAVEHERSKGRKDFYGCQEAIAEP